MPCSNSSLSFAVRMSETLVVLSTSTTAFTLAYAKPSKENRPHRIRTATDSALPLSVTQTPTDCPRLKVASLSICFFCAGLRLFERCTVAFRLNTRSGRTRSKIRRFVNSKNWRRATALLRLFPHRLPGQSPRPFSSEFRHQAVKTRADGCAVRRP